MAPTTLPPAAWGQVLFFIGLAEGQTSAGLFDLWLGNTEKREPGNLGWGTQFLSKDKKAADKMRLKELKNGRLAMLAIMGVAFNHVIPGALPLAQHLGDLRLALHLVRVEPPDVRERQVR